MESAVTLTAAQRNDATAVEQTAIADAFRGAMARFASGVTVVSARDGKGDIRSATVSAFVSVSLAPPLLLVSIASRSGTLGAALDAARFGVTVLHSGQERLALHCARPSKDRQAELQWVEGKTGVPLLAAGLARFECAVADRIDAGDHTLLLGRVLDVESGDDRPLIYFGRAFHTLSPR